MQIKLTQDYYGFLRQSLPIDRQAGPEQAPPRAPPSRQTVLPAERTVEGELLKNRNRNSSILSDLLQRGRFTDDSLPPDVPPQTAQRAIDAYRAYAGVPPGSGGTSRSIDYYA